MIFLRAGRENVKNTSIAATVRQWWSPEEWKNAPNIPVDPRQGIRNKVHTKMELITNDAAQNFKGFEPNWALDKRPFSSSPFGSTFSFSGSNNQ